MAAVIPHASEAAKTVVNWRRFGALAAIVVGIPVLYWPAARSLAALWLDAGRTSYTHGFAVLAVSCWLLWRKRDELSMERAPGDARFTALWIASLAVSVLAWQVAYRAGLQIGIEVLLLAIVWLAIGAFLGTRAARAAFAPVAFLGFALTLWDALNPLLLWATVGAVRQLLRLFDVPAYIEGEIVHIPSGVFEIQGGCSGLHFLIVALAIAALIGELRGDGWRRRVQWLLLGTALALVVNWIRVATIIYAGHVTHMQSYLVRESHVGYGWVLFAAATFVLFLIERRTPLTPPAPLRPSHARLSSSPRSPLVTVSTAVLVAMPLLLNAAIDRGDGPVPMKPLAMARGAWAAAPASTGLWTPRQLNADHEDRAAFALGSSRVERYVGVYSEQRTGKKFGGYANRPQGDAQVIERTRTTMGSLQFAEASLESEGRHSMLFVTYEVAGRAFDDPTRAQLWYSVMALRSLRSPASRVIALWSPCDTDCNAARRAVHQFVDDGGIQ